MNVQITEETHQLLKEYCDEHGYKMSFIVDKIIKNYIQPLPKFKGLSEEKIREAWDYTKSKGYIEAKEQNDSKNKLAEDMRRCYVDVLDTQAVQNELTTYELDPLDREIIVNKTKLKQINKPK